eukprot:364439-Chlamydomonas_euryale.AAC.17
MCWPVCEACAGRSVRHVLAGRLSMSTAADGMRDGMCVSGMSSTERMGKGGGERVWVQNDMVEVYFHAVLATGVVAVLKAMDAEWLASSAWFNPLPTPSHLRRPYNRFQRRAQGGPGQGVGRAGGRTTGRGGAAGAAAGTACLNRTLEPHACAARLDCTLEAQA